MYIFKSVSRYYRGGFHYIEASRSTTGKQTKLCMQMNNLPALDINTWVCSCSTNTHIYNCGKNMQISKQGC